MVRDANYASAFLCHASADAELVRRVAIQLGRRGVIPWLDALSLNAGESTSVTIAEAVEAATVVVVFLSADAAQSAWVSDEIKAAVRRLDREQARRRLILVHPGDPKDLSLLPQVLHAVVLHTDRAEVDCHMVMTAQHPSERAIARAIAKRVYKLLGTAEEPDVNVVLDQRGDGLRVGPPPPLGRLDLSRPTLVFRPDAGARDRKQLLSADGWMQFQAAVRGALSAALPTTRSRTVHIAGAAQLALPLMLGFHLSRSSNVVLRVHARQGPQVFSNACQPMEMPMGPKAFDGYEQLQITVPSLDHFPKEIDLLLSPPNRQHDVEDYIAAMREQNKVTPEMVWIETGRLKDSNGILNIAANVIGMLDKYSHPAVRLYTALPFHALPILGANLDMVVKRMSLMEYNQQAAEAGEGPEHWYTELPLPARAPEEQS